MNVKVSELEASGKNFSERAFGHIIGPVCVCVLFYSLRNAIWCAGVSLCTISHVKVMPVGWAGLYLNNNPQDGVRFVNRNVWYVLTRVESYRPSVEFAVADSECTNVPTSFLSIILNCIYYCIGNYWSRTHEWEVLCCSGTHDPSLSVIWLSHVHLHMWTLLFKYRDKSGESFAKWGFSKQLSREIWLSKSLLIRTKVPADCPENRGSISYCWWCVCVCVYADTSSKCFRIISRLSNGTHSTSFVAEYVLLCSLRDLSCQPVNSKSVRCRQFRRSSLSFYRSLKKEAIACSDFLFLTFWQPRTEPVAIEFAEKYFL